MTLPRFAQSLGGRSLASLSRWEDAPSLRSVAGGTLPRFAQSLGDAPSLRSVTCHSMVPTIEKMSWYLLIKEGKLSHKYAFLRANEVINMHSGGPTEQ